MHPASNRSRRHSSGHAFWSSRLLLSLFAVIATLSSGAHIAHAQTTITVVENDHRHTFQGPMTFRLTAQSETKIVAVRLFYRVSGQTAAHRTDLKIEPSTRIEVERGRYTGRIAPPIIKGADKADQIKRHLSSHGLDVDWNASYAYGDSYSDRLFMTFVGHPVAVHPDPKLRSMALANNWEVLESAEAAP